MMNEDIIGGTLAELNKAFRKNNYEECVLLSQALQMDINQHVKLNHGSTFDEPFYASLTDILAEEENKWAGDGRRLDADLSLTSALLGCIKNTFYQSSLNQHTVATTPALLRPIVAALDHCVVCTHQNANLSRRNGSFVDTLSVCLATFVNMMAGNSDARKILFPCLKSPILSLIASPEMEASHVTAALLHQFLLERDLKSQLDLVSLLRPLLASYMKDGGDACFARFCVESLLQAEDLLLRGWSRLEGDHRLLLLDIMTALTYTEPSTIHLSNMQFLQTTFKDEADTIFRPLDKTKKSSDPKVICRVANTLCCGASADHFRQHFQADKSLLISTVYLLRSMRELGKSPDGRPAGKGPDIPPEDCHPTFGFKSDLIRLIGALVYRNTDNQDTVRETNGLLLLLESSRLDERHPLVREACVLALRHALEANADNQKLIADMEMRGVADDKVLERLNVRLHIHNNKLQFKPEN